MNPLLLLTRPHADIAHMTVVGPLDRTTCQEFYDTATRLLAPATDPRPLTVNLRCCTFVDDVGLETLDALGQLTEQRGSALRLEAVPPLIEHVIGSHGQAAPH